jgi:hypothetical protein
MRSGCGGRDVRLLLPARRCGTQAAFGIKSVGSSQACTCYARCFATHAWRCLTSCSLHASAVLLLLLLLLLRVHLAEVISQYKSAASSSSGPGSSSSAESSTAGSSSSAGGRQGRVQMNSEGLPLRPNAGICQHYVKHGWCVFKQECWYNHPERYVVLSNKAQQLCGVADSIEGVARVLPPADVQVAE